MNKKSFIDDWIIKIESEGVKDFPIQFIDNNQLDIFSIPHKTLILGSEFFGNFEVLTTDGELIYQVSSIDEAKFFIYSSRKRDGKAYLPKNKSLIKNLVNEYHQYLDDLLNKIQKDFKIIFPNDKDAHIIAIQIFQKLNLIRY